MEQKHSGLGLSSFFISIISGVALIATLAWAGVAEVSTPGGIDEQSPTAVIIGLSLIIALTMNLIAIGLGIAGVIQKPHKRLFGILGLCFSGSAVLGCAAILAVGSAGG